MKLTRLSTAAIIIAGIILLLFVLSVPRAEGPAAPAPAQKSAAAPPTVTLSDSYKKGMHTISGSVVAPDACTSVSAAATLVGDAANPQGISLALTMPSSTGVCLQVPTRLSFSAAFAAPAALPIKVMVNGSAASTTP